MKKLLFLALIFSVLSVVAMEFTVEPSEELYYSRMEDIYPKKTAEKYYGKKIIDASDWFGPDSGGEDIFVDEDMGLEDEDDYKKMIIEKEKTSKQEDEEKMIFEEESTSDSEDGEKMIVEEETESDSEDDEGKMETSDSSDIWYPYDMEVEKQ